MALLKSFSRNSGPLQVEGEGLFLRLPQASDFEEWANVRANSRGHLTPWEPVWAQDELTKTAWKRRLRAYDHEVKKGEGWPFLIFQNSDGAMVGGLRLSNIKRGVQQSCSVGYWTGVDHAGHGLMQRAVKAVLPFVFDELGLHRLEAACLPHNEPSKRVLENVGFKREGLARQYLRINGQWQDHLLYAMVRGDPASGVFWKP